ncbi:hypothetical protein TNCV_2195431 [Trichonephila clavipes]|uniref:Uncharacterized protein n=1 Tax=Trichonephila clavipes TaxID=2585209 RepID=A0A8X6SKE6_TRICX|nr:hypothetical protein TNCV_2195431 [Trichonephila clavipes]
MNNAVPVSQMIHRRHVMVKGGRKKRHPYLFSPHHRAGPNTTKAGTGRFSKEKTRLFVKQASNMRTIGDGPRNFEPQSSDENDTSAGTSISKLPHIASGKTLRLEI